MRAYFRGFGSGRVFGLLGVSALASLVAGCGWFDSTPTVKVTPVRPGAERSVPAGGLQATGTGRQYDGDIRPVDESRPIGSVIPDKGGQKAQLDATAKEAAERDSATREEEAKRKAEAPAPITPASVPSADAVPPPPNLTGTSAVPLPPNLPGTSAPVPPPGPVSSAPVPPPSSSAPESAAPAALPTPGRPPAAQP